MADCASYDCGQDFPTRVQTGCNTKFRGGSNKAIMFRCGESVDPDSPTLSDDVQAIIDAGNAAVLTSIQINVDAPSPVTGPSLVGCVPDGFITNDHTITLVDRNVTPEVNDFYNSILRDFGAEIGGLMFYECDADRVTYYDIALSLQGGRVFPVGKTELQRYEFSLVGQDDELPAIITTEIAAFTNA